MRWFTLRGATLTFAPRGWCVRYGAAAVPASPSLDVRWPNRADLQVAQRALPVGHLALDVATDRVNQIVFRSMGLVVNE